MNFGPRVMLCAVLSPLPLAVLASFFGIGGWLYIIGLAHILFLGVPAFLLLLRFKRIRWWSMSMAGFVAGALPIGIWTWPHYDAAVSRTEWVHGKEIMTIQNGSLTSAGWWGYAYGVLFMAACGLVCALIFLGIWNILKLKKSMDLAQDPSQA